jgi:hypothetical protein
LQTFDTRPRLRGRVFLFGRAAAVVAAAIFLASCEATMPAPKKDINAVLAAHDKELIAKPGVVGVYVGTLDDGKTPCLKIMLAKADPEIERSLPKVIEGYRVVTEVTGAIRPMK